MPQLHQPEPGLSWWWGRGSRKWTTLQSRELGELKSLGVWSLGHFFSLLRTFFKKDSVLKKKKKKPDILVLVYLRMQAPELALPRASAGVGVLGQAPSP